MAKLNEIAQSAIKEWQDEHGEAEIRIEIKRTLDSALRSIIAAAFGIEEDHFNRGEWRIKSYGATEKWIDESAKDSVRQYLSEHLATDLPALTESVKTEIRKEFKAAVLDLINDSVRDAARDIVAQLVDEVVTEETQKFDFSNLEVRDQDDENIEEPDPWKE